MTKNRARKRLVRERAAKTGESYAAALRQLLTTKEKTVTTPTPETTPESTADALAPVPKRCVVCDSHDDPERTYRRLGHPVCDRCDDAVRATVLEHLGPVAERHHRPYEYLVLTLVYEQRKDDETAYLHLDLHSFAPGLVIGRRAVTVEALREALVEVTGDDRLHLNIRQHHPFAKSCRAEEPAQDEEGAT